MDLNGYSAPGREGIKQSIVMSVTLCLTVREHISGTTRPIFINYVHVTYRCNSVLSSSGIAICYVLPGLLDVVVFT